ncbi:MAG: HAMP domain-containing protein [Ignavibacteria bacterium]|jgi:methyl-accepting chemotaxis protein|nr:HAMP domain-containing protein [Ignavibacteria bacterium]MCU7501764.1 HAMP domain-containing protein [Ignavibacteria bacterium]MCU7516829.1 HAMP domain-containing protein [Ignavibacteria bacterium]
MQWFLNLSIRVKLYLSFGLILLALLIVALISAFRVSSLRQSQQRLAGVEYNIAINSIEVRSNLNRLRIKLLQYLMPEYADQRAALLAEARQMEQVVENYFKRLLDFDTQQFPDRNEVLEMKREYDHLKEGIERQVQLVGQNRASDAVVYGRANLAPLYERIRSAAIGLAEKTSNSVDRHVQEVNQAFESYLTQLGIIGLLFLMVFIIVVYYLDKIMARPIQTLEGFSDKISQGEVDFAMPELKRTDEIGSLWDTFSRMTVYLKEITAISNNIASGNLNVRARPRSERDVLANSLNVMIANLNKVTSDLRETVNVLNSSTSEILAGVAQLAASSSEIASSIGETTSTVEEVRKTSENSNAKSRDVLDIASRATDYSESGQKSTEETREGIDKIGSQMIIIAENIIRLSEHSKVISDIIIAVNDIAEQTNLLAVNASIEAVRAGEHGKAFAVVAQEIKSLAEQSKQSTTQVRSALNDIQNAINSAVLATEQGEKIVDTGIKLAGESGEAIQKLVDTINVAKDAAFQTSVTSHEQVVGMEQITLAMENIKLASSQNVTTTRQLETSAKDLQMLSKRLKELVTIFKAV